MYLYTSCSCFIISHSKAKEAEKMAKEIERKKFREKEEKINGELQGLLQSDK